MAGKKHFSRSQTGHFNGPVILRGRLGSTILEIAVAISLVAILSIILGNIFISHNQAYRAQISQIEISQENILALSRIKQLVTEASKILANQTIGQTNYVTGANTLVLQLPAFDANGDPIVGMDYAAIFSDPVDPKIVWAQLQTSAGSRRLTSKTLITALKNNLEFKYETFDPTLSNTATVYLETAKFGWNADLNFSQSATFYLRNK